MQCSGLISHLFNGYAYKWAYLILKFRGGGFILQNYLMIYSMTVTKYQAL
jgi:hypothetical protein